MTESRVQPTSRMCFICGRDNPVGLRLQFVEEGDAQQVRAVGLVIPDQFQGYPGVAHGGIVAAVLDETAGRAVLLRGNDEELMATARLTVRYRCPTPTGVPLCAVGWLERRGGVAVRVAAEIRLPDGTVTADCQCILADVPDAFREGWQQEKPFWRVER